jgi:hypothetical protein
MRPLQRRTLAAGLALSLACACAAAQESGAPAAPPAPALPAAGGEISWEQALALIRSGELRSAMQTHALDVVLVAANGARYTAREPEIDAVLRAVRELAPNAGEISLATE